MLPSFVQDFVQAQLGGTLQHAKIVSGGDINNAAKVTIADDLSYFVKWHQNPPPGMFSAEVHGLHLLYSAMALRIPQPYHYNEQILITEWLDEGERRSIQAAQTLGYGLAQQHQFTFETFGLGIDNYCGLTPQCNQPRDSWVVFFAEHRLRAQLDLAAQNQRLPGQRGPKLERLIQNLANHLPDQPPTSLLHGDLWGGNWLVTAEGQPALIDPAVYFGHREADLAFTELFGGFPPEFYRAYQEAWPLEPGYADRKEIYNLYHLLNHLNLFGEGYGRQVDAVLDRFS